MQDLVQQIAQMLARRPDELDEGEKAQFYNWLQAGAPDISGLPPTTLGEQAGQSLSLGAAAGDAVRPVGLGGAAGDTYMDELRRQQLEALRRAGRSQ